MNDAEYKQAIAEAIRCFQKGEWSKSAVHLLDVLGYRSERTLELSGSADDFIEQFPAANENTKTEQAFCDNVQSVRILFQLTDAEIAAQSALFDAGDFDAGNARSFLFAAVELNGTSYPRGQYATVTREINKRFPMPTVVLFKTADSLLSLSFVHRRPHKRDPERDVLGNVSLIREIDPAAPHRAHLDILADLALDARLGWMSKHDKAHNFDGLLDAWLEALDTEELNRRFYGELFAWFERAVSAATFPSDSPIEQQVIRLITRILFVWFIKEKRLVAEEWFIRAEMEKLLANFGGSDYYRAILQNLFFATLNTEIGERGFSTRTYDSHRVFSRYRYRSLMRDETRFEGLMKQTPFINGGLFDCLDSEDSRSAGGKRIDMFSDPDPTQYPDARRTAWRELNVPDDLFFDQERGLFPLLTHYKFTVEENTPIEQEVALDPELLGKVFENLLAAYNPETRESARKQTGSYYTPRAVVDYMVDEALIASLSEKCPPTDGDAAFWQDRLRYLLDYEDAFDDANELFEESETVGIVRAISEISVLDPAVGSGAFPMGMLHKMTLVLRRLDPDNSRWAALQKERARAKADAAFETRDQRERDAELLEISETFERYSGDFGRKLYLIQNSIFGVDIQSIACQIAKLRFFISLAIEQEVDDTAKNFGIKPLPNLETRFVAANTLMQLEDAAQLDLFRQQIEALKTKLAENRERHFHATTRQKKLACRDEDKGLRQALAGELNSAGLPADDANKIAHWDPYDQNAKADWFDAEYMFGIADGFDVVIGNPPYIQLQKNRGELGRLYKDAGYATFARTGDVYQLFYEKGCQLLKPQHGLLSYITSNSWLKAEYGKATRRYFAEKHTPLQLLEMGKDVFENAIVDTNILIVRHGKSGETGKAVDMDRLTDKTFPPDASLWGQFRPQGEKPWSALSATEQSVMDKIEAIGTPLKEWDISINYGIKTGYNDAFIIDNRTKDTLIAEDPNSAEIIKPVLRGRDIQRYQAQWAGLWLIYARKGLEAKRYPAVYSHLQQHQSALSKKAGANQWYELQASPSDSIDALFEGEKLFWMDLTEQGRFAYDTGGMSCVNTVYMMSGQSIKYLCAVLNSKLITWFMKNTAPTSGMGVTRWFSIYVETIPIPKISTTAHRSPLRVADSPLSSNVVGLGVNNDKYDFIVTIVDYIIYLKKQPSTTGKNLAHARDYVMVKYFEQIIDGLVYELYLTDELHRAGKYFFKPLLDERLPPIEEITGDKMSALRGIFERLFDKKHPVRKNLFFLDSLEAIRIIEGKT